MKFDVSRAYSAINAAELKIGSKVIVADNLKALVERVELNAPVKDIVRSIGPEWEMRRIATYDDTYALAYLVEEPAKLKWTDLKVGDIIRRGAGTRMVVGIDADSSSMHIYTGTAWLDDEELEEWEKVEK